MRAHMLIDRCKSVIDKMLLDKKVMLSKWFISISGIQFDQWDISDLVIMI